MNLPLQKALLRSDLSSFIQMTFRTVAPGLAYLHNWHIDAIAYHLNQCLEGKIKRLIITIPPRHLKTISVSIALPAFALGNDPTNRIICASYSQELANRYSLDCRKVMESAWYRSIFPKARLRSEKNSLGEIMTYKRGYRLATSVGGTLTGRGGNLIIIDDPHKPEETYSKAYREAVLSWYRTTLLSRLDNKQEDTIIVIQQRLHEEDLAGYLLAQGGCVHLNLPAIAEKTQKIEIGEELFITRNEGDLLHPEREPGDLLKRIRYEMGSYVFAAQYQQRPAPIGGGIIKKEWLTPYAYPQTIDKPEMIVQSWDTASKADDLNDYSVCTTWFVKDKLYYLVGLFREKLEYPELKSAIISEKEKWNATAILIEDASAGTSLINDLKYDGDIRPIGIIPKNDKATRLMAVSPEFENGRVRIPDNAPWLASLTQELLTFPNAKHDDQVDSISQFLGWMIGKRNTIEWELL